MYKKILVPLDGSEFSECSLAHARAIAQGCQVPEVIILRVVEPLSTQVSATMAEAGGTWLIRAEESNRQEAEAYMAGMSERLKNEGWMPQTVLTFGRAADEILDYARDNKVELIIMTTHGRSGISRFAFGSVADKVVRHSPIPVLTIAPPGCRQEVK